ncbi:MAG: NAD-dependent epimerase/dehydratase family protein [Syntrophales bacterium]|nr:NAD-dependent epimerase/dehydratase family protein [Syntrophales bacterium]
MGSHVADELLSHGYSVRVIDCLADQVHGKSAGPPDYLSPDVEFIYGNILDEALLERSLKGVDAVLHLAAAVGVGQSMYEPDYYTGTNNLGTAVLLKLLLQNPVKRLVVASSMSIYGEGLYRSTDGIDLIIDGCERTAEQLKAGIWEHYDGDGNRLAPIPTS